MEICSLQAPSVSVSGTPRSNLKEKPFLTGNFIRLPRSKRFPDRRKLGILSFRARVSGIAKDTSRTTGAAAKDTDIKDGDLVFVAGATGRVGSRTVRELLKLGFRVRAGVRSVQRAESLLQSVKQMNLDEGASSASQPIEKLEIVECDLENKDEIGPAIGNASVIICCIGASEKEIFDITGPYRIDYLATKNLINAATIAKVNHFILLTSLGTNKVGFPAAILNLFWGVLIWKRKAEEELLASGLPYAIVRPGGMERPTDSFKETHNTTLSEEDTLFGGLVSNLQVAELLAFMAKNPNLSCCKVVEVIAETMAPLTPLEQLLAKIPSQRSDSKRSEPVEKPEPTDNLTKPSTTSTQENPTEVKAVTTPLSPYIAYEDLKPPTSPSPTPSGKAEAIKSNSTQIETAAPIGGGNDIAKVNSAGTVNRDPYPRSTSRHSPYLAYEDLKPPTSPSPTPCGKVQIINSNSIQIEAAIQIDGGNDVAKMNAAGTVDKDPYPKSTSRHSPYLAYEDLKPPTSPTPAPRK